MQQIARATKREACYNRRFIFFPLFFVSALVTEDIPVIRLQSKCDRRIKSGHLWIYSNEIDLAATPIKTLAPGAEVLVQSASEQVLGRGYVNPHSLITCRLLTRDGQDQLNQIWFEHRLRQALSLREAIYSAPYYRLVYGDSDGLSGLVVDRFGDYLVAQLNTAGMDRLRDIVLAALVAVLKPKAVLWRNDSAQREIEGLVENAVTVAYGEWPEQLRVEENGVEFYVDGLHGQKTGWFYDHRENRRELMRWVKGKRVLDLFSYVGGWGLQCLAGGAESLVAVDASTAALAQLHVNARNQGKADQVSCLDGNAFTVLETLVAEGQKFDVVIADPPAFIKRKKEVNKGLAAYKKLNTLAMRLVAPNGLLMSASCSMHLHEEELIDLVRGAGRHIDRHPQLVFRGSQGPDHPVHPAIPETSYLKACLFRISLSL